MSHRRSSRTASRPNSDGKPLLDLQAKTWEVNATVVRVPKEGLIVRPRPKTAPGWRVVPNFAVQMVRDRGASSRRRAVPGPPRAHLARPVERLRRPAATARRVRLRRGCPHRIAARRRRLRQDWLAGPTAPLRRRTLVVGNVARLPQDGRNETRRSRLHAPPGRGPARPCESVDDARRLLRPPRRQRSRRASARSLTPNMARLHRAGPPPEGETGPSWLLLSGATGCF